MKGLFIIGKINLIAQAYDINVNNLIESYFNLYFKRKFLNDKYISRYSRKKRNSLQKIYVSKADVKHTNSKALINIFIYNKEKMVLLKNIENFLLLKSKIYKMLKRKELFYNLHKINKKKIFFSLLKIKKNKNIEIYFRKLKLKFSLNKYKFERILLYRLGVYLKKIYKKRIEFNLVRLNSINFNIDILVR